MVAQICDPNAEEADAWDMLGNQPPYLASSRPIRDLSKTIKSGWHLKNKTWSVLYLLHPCCVHLRAHTHTRG